ncbi:MAG: hypothetical protein ACK4JD_06540 [Thermoflexales bacterium]
MWSRSAYPVQANAVFAIAPRRQLAALREHSFFYEWADLDEERAIVRWMCAWDTSAEDVDAFAAHVARVLRPA